MDLTYDIIFIVLLILASAFFSGSETGMMSLNRYRLRHQARKNNEKAQRLEKLLRRPDRLLGVILVGNTFANILASAILTMVIARHFGEAGVFIATIVLTLVVLIFAETAPKTMAALNPEWVSYRASIPLKFLLTLFYPLVWVINTIANFLLRLLGVTVQRSGVDALSTEELRTVVLEATGKISISYQKLLLRILELERMTVADVMVPRNEIYGIDLDASWDTILDQITNCPHSHIPLYREKIIHIEGVLRLRKALVFMQKHKLTKDKLIGLADKLYYVPETALLNRQLLNFQDQQKSLGIVVDEYSEIQGLVTLQDIVEEVVGEFSGYKDEMQRQVALEKNGSVIVDGAINIRDLNRFMSWGLPVKGPKTLSGLLVEYLEMIPTAGVACRIAGYPMEVLKIENNLIKSVQVWPELVDKEYKESGH